MRHQGASQPRRRPTQPKDIQPVPMPQHAPHPSLPRHHNQVHNTHRATTANSLGAAKPTPKPYFISKLHVPMEHSGAISWSLKEDMEDAANSLVNWTGHLNPNDENTDTTCSCPHMRHRKRQYALESLELGRHRLSISLAGRRPTTWQATAHCRHWSWPVLDARSLHTCARKHEDKKRTWRKSTPMPSALRFTPLCRASNRSETTTTAHGKAQDGTPQRAPQRARCKSWCEKHHP